jgi:hypothetical protein
MPGHVKSHVVGRATDSGGVRTTAYRAVDPFVRAQCRDAISPDHVFSRRARRAPRGGIGLKTEPVCVACRPLRLEESVDG